MYTAPSPLVLRTLRLTVLSLTAGRDSEGEEDSLYLSVSVRV